MPISADPSRLSLVPNFPALCDWPARPHIALLVHVVSGVVGGRLPHASACSPNTQTQKLRPLGDLEARKPACSRRGAGGRGARGGVGSGGSRRCTERARGVDEHGRATCTVRAHTHTHHHRPLLVLLSVLALHPVNERGRQDTLPPAQPAGASPCVSSREPVVGRHWRWGCHSRHGRARTSASSSSPHLLSILSCSTLSLAETLTNLLPPPLFAVAC